jgi:hypothetical protein
MLRERKICIQDLDMANFMKLFAAYKAPKGLTHGKKRKRLPLFSQKFEIPKKKVQI